MPMHLVAPGTSALCRYTNIGTLTSSANALKQIGSSFTNPGYRYALVAANGDRYFLYFSCDATETQLNISNNRFTSRGIFDLYVNGVLDSAGYDDYAAVQGVIDRQITLAQPIRRGENIIELRVNGKNVASTDWRLAIYGANLQ